MYELYAYGLLFITIAHSKANSNIIHYSLFIIH